MFLSSSHHCQSRKESPPLKMANFRNLEEATFDNSKDYIADFSEAVQPEKLVARMFDLLKRLYNETSITETLKMFLKFGGEGSLQSC